MIRRCGLFFAMLMVPIKDLDTLGQGGIFFLRERWNLNFSGLLSRFPGLLFKLRTFEMLTDRPA